MKKKVLIIEDDPDILDMMDFILTDRGYEVIGSDCAEPLREIHKLKPDLILMDNRIKDGFGNDFCRLLKSDPATAHYPVVLSSANPDLQLMAKNCLADGYLAKPFELEELVALADRFLVKQ